jgi:hypothetical protein
VIIALNVMAEGAGVGGAAAVAAVAEGSESVALVCAPATTAGGVLCCDAKTLLIA